MGASSRFVSRSDRRARAHGALLRAGSYGFTISDSTTMSSSYANELPSAGGFLIV